MNMQTGNEILIHAHRVNTTNSADPFEFVFNDSLQVVECVQIPSLSTGMAYPVLDFRTTLQGVLFELNHVRVDPLRDNTRIIESLTNAFADIGVDIYNAPSPHSMQMTYRPLGEIADRIRFYFTESGHCVFLCPNAKLKETQKRRLGR